MLACTFSLAGICPEGLDKREGRGAKERRNP
jgi:hypothetical protein